MADANKELPSLLKVFDDAIAAEDEAALLYEKAEDLFTQLQIQRGVSVEGRLARYVPMIKKYVPLLLAGGGGTALTALVADSGAFGGVIKGLLSVLGMSAG